MPASKETLDRHFGNKEELFADIVRRGSARITGGQDGELDMNGTPRDVLGRLGRNLLDFLTSADSLSFCRMMVAEATRAPGLAAKLFLGAIVANYQILGLIAPGLEPFKGKKMPARVEGAVALFLGSLWPIAKLQSPSAYWVGQGLACG